NTLEGDIQVRLLTNSRIEGNTFKKLEMDTTGGAAFSSGVVIQGNVLEGIDADNGSHVLEEGVVANNILTTDFGIRLNQGSPPALGKGNTVSGNNFINNAGPIRTNYGSTVTANINVNEIDAGTVSTSTISSTITGNQGASGGLVITSYGGSIITNNVDVTTAATGSGSVVSNNTFTAVSSSINIGGGNCTVSGNRQTNSSGSLTISLGAVSTPANDCSVSGNFTEGGNIEVAGSTCSIFNNNLGFIDALGGGVGSIRVGASAGAVSTGGKNCTVTGNVLPGGTIYLVRGQNILVGNILVYTEVDGSGAEDSIMGAHITSAGGASGAIIIDAGAQFSPGDTLGSFHSNVFIGNMYRGGGAASDFGPAVTIAVGAGNSRPFEGGDGDLQDGKDLCHTLDGTTQRRLNLEE
ncbi:MAG: hypothetical protein CMA70_04805, partial [Euryarchaeota archaeon]|nr:hypothetical protein [Euryarchaeota archaeon]